MTDSYVINGLPSDILTDERAGVRRLQVDQGSTGFFDGREFRYWRKAALTTGATIWVVVTVPDNGIILKAQSLVVDDGTVDFNAYRDATVTGLTLTDTVSPNGGTFPNNNLPSAPAYTQLTTIQESATGTLSSGTVAEYTRIRTSGATGQRTTVSAGVQGERGVGTGTYYLAFTAVGANASFAYYLTFEERTGEG